MEPDHILEEVKLRLALVIVREESKRGVAPAFSQPFEVT